MKLHTGLILLLSLAPLPAGAQLFVRSSVPAHSQPLTASSAKEVPPNSGLWGVEVAQLTPSALHETTVEAVVVVVKVSKHSPARHVLSPGERIRWISAGGSAKGRVSNPAEFYRYASQCVHDCILQMTSSNSGTLIAGFRAVGKLGTNYLREYDPSTKKLNGYLDTKTGQSYDPETEVDANSVEAGSTRMAEGPTSPWEIAAGPPPSAGN